MGISRGGAPCLGLPDKTPQPQARVRCETSSYDRPNEFVQGFCPVVLSLTESPGVLLGCDDNISTAGPRLLDAADRTGADQPHPRRPVENSLHSRDRAPVAATRTGWTSTPLQDRDRLQPVNRQVAGN